VDRTERLVGFLQTSARNQWQDPIAAASPVAPIERRSPPVDNGILQGRTEYGRILGTGNNSMKKQ
jgi:hypothetical protein